MLDGATSGLDEQTERQICEHVARAIAARGVIAAGLRPSALTLMPRRWTLAERDGANVLLAA